MKPGSILEPDNLSPLAVDLAVSRVSLAALKLLSAIPPSEEERSWATRLRQSLASELTGLRSGEAISEDVVPGASLRRELEETFGMLTDFPTYFHRQDIGLLENLVQLLDDFAAGEVAAPAAEDLLKSLLALGSRTETLAAAGEPAIADNGNAS